MNNKLEQVTKGGNVASIGFFDGVHSGHRFLIERVKQIASDRGMQSMLITFYEHPRTVLHSDYIPQLLTSPNEKLSLLHQTGIDHVELLHFTPELSRLTAKEYMQQVLRDKLGVTVLVMGYDHRFGHDGGTPEQYLQWGQEVGIEVLTMSAAPTPQNEHNVSSSLIRRLLTEGAVADAAKLLEHNYTLQGEVVGGHQVGREIGFPTANLKPHPHKLIPRNGVYAVLVDVCDRHYQGMLNIGERPTIDSSHTLSIEVNIFDFHDDLYGEQVTIHFVDRLREERRFESREALTAQIKEDEIAARRVLEFNK